MTVNSLPRVGDVLFFNSHDVGTIVSRIVQTWLDPDAAGAPRTFGHVAVVISDLLALEAMPADPEDLKDRTASLKDTVAFGEWTDSELRGGVRLIPIADLVVPAMQHGRELVVLRTLNTTEEALSNLSPDHRDVLRMLGSQYSIDLLRKEFVHWPPNSMKRLFDAKFDWTSTPIDLSTLSGIDSELRNRVEAILPDFPLPDVARTYFCSQAVIKCLNIAGLLQKDSGTDLTTPSGLYKLLLDRKWLDVSTFYECAPDAKEYLGMRPLDHSASYTASLARSVLAIKADAINLQAEYIRSSVEVVNRLISSIMPRKNGNT